MESNQSVSTPEQATYEIIIHAKRIKGENAAGKKYDFLSFEGYDKDGHKCSFKFTKDVKNKPDEAGEYVIVVLKTQINRDKRVRYNEYWIRAVESIKPYVPQFSDNVEDLPF